MRLPLGPEPRTSSRGSALWGHASPDREMPATQRAAGPARPSPGAGERLTRTALIGFAIASITRVGSAADSRCFAATPRTPEPIGRGAAGARSGQVEVRHGRSRRLVAGIRGQCHLLRQHRRKPVRRGIAGGTSAARDRNRGAPCPEINFPGLPRGVAPAREVFAPLSAVRHFGVVVRPNVSAAAFE